MRRKIGSVIQSEADRRPPTQAAPRVAASTMSTVMRSTTLMQVQAQTTQDAQRSKGSSTSIEAKGLRSQTSTCTQVGRESGGIGSAGHAAICSSAYSAPPKMASQTISPRSPNAPMWSRSALMTSFRLTRALARNLTHSEE